MLRRVRSGVRDRGVVGLARTALAQARRYASLDVVHYWYELELAAERPRRELPEGLRLRRGTAEDLDFAAAQSTQVGRTTVERRLADGDELWIVEGEQRAFSCWIFRDAMPCVAAPGERLAAPPGVAGLDDSNTAEASRGRGIAPAAWTAIADMLQAEGLRAMVTPVEEDNAASRRAVQKAGFREVAVVRTTRRAGRMRVSVSGPPGAFRDEVAKLAR